MILWPIVLSRAHKHIYTHVRARLCVRGREEIEIDRGSGAERQVCAREYVFSCVRVHVCVSGCDMTELTGLFLGLLGQIRPTQCVSVFVTFATQVMDWW